jgi:hypothetical protein
VAEVRYVILYNKVVSKILTGTRHTAINTLNAKLNPTCHLLALLGAHIILHVSVIRVNFVFRYQRHSNNTPCIFIDLLLNISLAKNSVFK